jgi:polyphosphate kinase
VDLYQSSDPVHFQLLAELCSLQEPLLKHPTFQPRHALHTQTQGAIFDAVKQKDILLHHPYDSFSTVVDFIDQAAVDPLTMAIKMTLYRTSGDSPIVKALIRAAQNEKPVTAIVELKARFDEANNIAWAKLMEEEGVHVVYGPVDMKTHCKMLMVVRREEEGIRHYVHLGTGNYHATTARLYTDVGLFTCNPLVTTEVAKLFNTLTGLSEFGHFEQLIVAPHQMHQRMLALIDGEIEHARQGRGGRIFLKLNALSEDKIISKLYEASCSGVRVDMVVRGICTLKPQLQGVSENIRVVSVVDRFLEHSRCYYFENGGDAKIYFGSADWMQRNFHKRVEVAFPILEPYWRDWVTKSLIPTYLKDNTKARVLGADGCYSKPLTNQDRHRAQAIFMP